MALRSLPTRAALSAVVAVTLVAGFVSVAPVDSAEAAVSAPVAEKIASVKQRNIQLASSLEDDHAFDVAPARAAIDRVIDQASSAQIALRAVDREAPGEDFFGISGADGAIVVSGTSPAQLLTGVNWYLKHVANADIAWDADNVSLPAVLGAPAQPIVRHATSSMRLYGNDITTDYTSANWSWEDWEREIDVLAFSGFNEVFMSIGQEAVAHQTFLEYGYTEAEMLAWTPPPSHTAAGMWQGGWNTDAGGRTAASEQRSLELGQRIVARLKELGITPVFPGFVGFVPKHFAEKNPGAAVVTRGDWLGEPALDWLDPRTTMYAQVAAKFYAKQEALFGTTRTYAMNPFTEGGSVNIPLGDAGKAIQDALALAHPDALWQMHAWQANPVSTLLSKLNPAKVIIVDFMGDRYGTSNRETAWPGFGYTFGGVWNFGGHTTLGANGTVWANRYWEVLSRAGSNMDGVALSPEGGHGDAAALELFSELAWTEEPIDVVEWFAAYGQRRSGVADAKISEAWRTIARTAYSTPADGWDESQDSLYNAIPSLTVKTAATWSPTAMRYDSAQFAEALSLLIEASPESRLTPAAKYDLAVVARQVLENDSRTLLPAIQLAYTSKDLVKFDRLTKRWLDNMTLVDALVATVPGFLLGNWVEDARAAGATAAEKQKFVHDAKEVLTSWGTTRAYASAGLQDYNNRAWSGLVSGYYQPRWAKYFSGLRTALTTNTTPAPIDWFLEARAWVEADANLYSTTASTADVYALAKEALAAHKALAPAAPPIGTTYLSDLEFLSASGDFARDKRVGGYDGGKSESIILDGVNGQNGVVFPKGIGVNSPSDLSFSLGGNCTTFTSTIGIDTSMNKSGAEGDVVFVVYVDGTERFRSGIMRAGAATSISVDTTGGKTLRLVVEIADVNNWWDRADWADAKITCVADRSTLDASIMEARTLLETTPVGTAAGAVSQAGHDTFAAALVAVADARDDAVTAADVKSVADALASAVAAFRQAIVTEGQRDVTVVASTRCVAGKVILTVRAANGEEVPVAATFQSAFGTKTFASIAPDKNAVHAFATRAAQVTDGAVTASLTATIDGTSTAWTAVAPYPATSCG